MINATGELRPRKSQLCLARLCGLDVIDLTRKVNGWVLSRSRRLFSRHGAVVRGWGERGRRRFARTRNHFRYAVVRLRRGDAARTLSRGGEGLRRRRGVCVEVLLCGAMARLAFEEGLCVDVATGGELDIVLRAGVPASGSSCTATTSPRRDRARDCRRSCIDWSWTTSTRSSDLRVAGRHLRATAQRAGARDSRALRRTLTSMFAPVKRTPSSDSR